MFLVTANPASPYAPAVVWRRLDIVFIFVIVLCCVLNELAANLNCCVSKAILALYLKLPVSVSSLEKALLKILLSTTNPGPFRFLKLSAVNPAPLAGGFENALANVCDTLLLFSYPVGGVPFIAFLASVQNFSSSFVKSKLGESAFGLIDLLDWISLKKISENGILDDKSHPRFTPWNIFKASTF